MLNLQVGSVLAPVINTMMSSISAQYLINPMYNNLVTPLNIFRPRGLTSLKSDVYKGSGRECYYVSTYRESPGFVEEERIASMCGTAPHMLSFAQDKCTSIGNKFKYYNLNINRSAVDSDACVAGQSAFFSNLAKLIFRLPALLSDLNRIAITAFFNGLFTEFKVSTGNNNTINQEWYDISSMPNNSIPSLATGGFSFKTAMSLGSSLMNNGTYQSDLSNYVMFMGYEDFEKFIFNIADKNMSCCNVALGKYNLNGMLRSYMDPLTNFRIVQVPDHFLRYDETSKKMIYPVVNMDNYYVTSGPSLMDSSMEDIASVGVANCERSIINIADYSVFYRAANGLITHSDGAWETFQTSMGAVRNNIRDVAFFVLGSTTDTDQNYAVRRIKSSNAGGIPADRIKSLTV